jgi:hypothetical protein
MEEWERLMDILEESVAKNGEGSLYEKFLSMQVEGLEGE